MFNYPDHELLTAEQEIELGSTPCHENALELFNHNTKLAVMLARSRYVLKRSATIATEEDFVAAALEGLWYSCQNYDPSKANGRFAGFARWHIQRSISRFVHHAQSGYTVPYAVYSASKHVKEGTEPTWKLSKNLLEFVKRTPSISTTQVDLLQNVLPDEHTLPDREAEFQDTLRSIVQKFRHLTPEQRMVLTRVYALDGEPPESLTDIGRRVKKSREMIRIIHRKAIRTVRKFIKQ